MSNVSENKNETPTAQQAAGNLLKAIKDNGGTYLFVDKFKDPELIGLLQGVRDGVITTGQKAIGKKLKEKIPNIKSEVNSGNKAAADAISQAIIDVYASGITIKGKDLTGQDMGRNHDKGHAGRVAPNR